jgi:hypothetical protein
MTGKFAIGLLHPGEMGVAGMAETTEIATTMKAAGLPEGFHLAAAVMFGRFPRGFGGQLIGQPSNISSRGAS